MKLKLLSIIFWVFGIVQLSAITPVSGGIFTNTTWTLANSPYLVTGNVVVFPGVTLTVQPGVEIRVKDRAFNQSGIYIEARGVINMIGNSNAIIKVRADSSTSSVGAWQGFVIKTAQGGDLNYDYVSFSNANTLFNYDATPSDTINVHKSEFSFHNYALIPNTAIVADSCKFKGNTYGIFGWSNFKLSNCTFDSNSVGINAYASAFNVHNCKFINNVNGILFASSNGNGLSIKKSSFIGNTNGILYPSGGIIDSCLFKKNFDGIEGATDILIKNSQFDSNTVALQAGFSTTVSDNNISNNLTGVILGPVSFGQPMPLVINNRICNNSNYNIDNGTDLNLFIPTNCFCETDSTIIESKIFDGYDDITKGLISYGIFDTLCLNVLQIVNKGGALLSISKLKENNWTIYPNPNSGTLNIDNNLNFESLEILNVSGAIQKTIQLFSGKNSFDISDLSQGLYYVKVKGNDVNSKLIKFVKS